MTDGKNYLYCSGMQLLPIKTRRLQPPQDDLATAIMAEQPTVQTGDVFLVSAKVVAIDEGQCWPIASTDKQELVDRQAEIKIPRSYWSFDLIITRHTFLSAAGVDESNGAGYYIGLPTDCMQSAAGLRAKLQKHFGVDQLGVIIVDSHSQPFRYGATGVALGWSGIAPLQDHRGRTDLFGRTVKVERSNVVDGLAAAATGVMGEVDEQTPVVIAHDVPGLTYTERTQEADLFASYHDDTFRVLYERWL